MKSKAWAWGLNLSLLLLAGVVTLGSFEVLLRVFLPQKLYRYPRYLFREDAELAFALNPAFVGILSSPEYRTRVTINSLGLRGKEVKTKTPGVQRTVFFGDSFVSALNVDEEETFVFRSQERLRELLGGRSLEVVNAGTPNYGTWHELRALRKLAPILDPDAVVLCVYVGNDLEDNLAPRAAIVRDGFLVERIRRTGVLPYPVRSWLQRNSMAYVFVWQAYDRLKPLLGLSGIDPLEGFRTIVSLQTSPRVEEGYVVSEDLLRGFREELAASEIPLLVVLIPAEMQVYPQRFESLLAAQKLEPAGFDLSLPNRRWNAIAQDLDIPILDLLPLFRMHASGPYLYMSLDGHLTSEGNQLAGEAIAGSLAPLLARKAGGVR